MENNLVNGGFDSKYTLR